MCSINLCHKDNRKSDWATRASQLRIIMYPCGFSTRIRKSKKYDSVWRNYRAGPPCIYSVIANANNLAGDYCLIFILFYLFLVVLHW